MRGGMRIDDRVLLQLRLRWQRLTSRQLLPHIGSRLNTGRRNDAMKSMCFACGVILVSACHLSGETTSMECAGIEREICASDASITAGQARLTDKCSLTDYASLMTEDGVWTKALQTALSEHEIVVLPARQEPYLIDAPIVLPSNRRLEASGATVRLAPGVMTVMLRTASSEDGTCRPLPRSGRVSNIAIVGGRWEDCSTARCGYGASGRFDLTSRRVGNFYGVSALFYLGRADYVWIRDTTFVHCGGFAVQSGDGMSHLYENIRFEDCFADGLHLNGNLERIHVRDVRGKVGDDLVALNAYDWLNSSVNFGPQRAILCEDLELVAGDGAGYPAIRLLPAMYRYQDGTIVDCSISDVIFRRVKGIRTFKMYLQTPPYRIGQEPEWSAVGSGGNILFEDIDIDLTGPIDRVGGYASSDPLRGHYAAFEFGANLSSVTIRDVTVRFHLDRYPLGHLVTVGPKSARMPIGEESFEVFDPDVRCAVEGLRIEGLRTFGAPRKLVQSISFEDINQDGRSSGHGVIRNLVITESKTRKGTSHEKQD